MSKKPISIDEYRMRPFIDAHISRLLDDMEDSEAEKLMKQDKFTEMLEKAYFQQKNISIDGIDPFFK